MTQLIEQQSVPLEVKYQGDQGFFEGYASIYDVIDTDGDIVKKGAFEESLKSYMPVLLWQHNIKEPIGKFTHISEDQYGLYVKGHLSLEGRGKEAYSLLKMGAIKGLSVGFVTEKASEDQKSKARCIEKAKLMEISLVTYPANQQAYIATVKQQKRPCAKNILPRDIRSFEGFLRHHGYTRKAAKAIALQGFHAADHQRTDHDEQMMVQSMIADIEARKKRRLS